MQIKKNICNLTRAITCITITKSKTWVMMWCPFLWGPASFKYLPFLPFTEFIPFLILIFFYSIQFQFLSVFPLSSPCFQSSSLAPSGWNPKKGSMWTREESMWDHLRVPTWMLVWDFSLKLQAQIAHQMSSWNLQWERQTNNPSLKTYASLKLAIYAISNLLQTKIFTCTGITKLPILSTYASFLN